MDVFHEQSHYDDVIAWLLEGDAAVQFQVYRDLLDTIRPELQTRIPLQGDASTILIARMANGHWGEGFYQPKWTSSHYSLLELRDMQVSGDHPACRETVDLIVGCKSADGGVNPTGSIGLADVCINGMFLAYASHFYAAADKLQSVIDFVLSQQMPDGGFNCHSNRKGSCVSSVHTTASVIDGFASYLSNGYSYRRHEVAHAMSQATETLLSRNLYQRRASGEPIKEVFTRLHHPARWHFDVLRGLEVLIAAGVDSDLRTTDALGIILQRRRPDGRWSAAAQYSGQTHLRYPSGREPNRWVTLRALRVLRSFGYLPPIDEGIVPNSS